MTTIHNRAIRFASISLTAVLIIASQSAKLTARELCWEECTFEMMGGCWRWQKACLNLAEEQRDPVARAGESDSRSPDRQQLPSHVGSLLAGGGLSTALNGAGETVTINRAGGVQY